MYKFGRTLPRKWNENYFTKPYYVWKKCFDDALIQKIVDLGESLSQVDARVGSGDQSRLNEDTRISKLSWIPYNEQAKEIYDFWVKKIDSVNYWQYGLALDAMEHIQYTRYPIGGHYNYHNDIVVRTDEIMRKLTFVVAITDESEYTGGDFCIAPHGGDRPTRIRFQKGDMIAFPAYTPHKVEPVLTGHRITAVTWCYGPKFV